jgi:hypothetical protein
VRWLAEPRESRSRERVSERPGGKREKRRGDLFVEVVELESHQSVGRSVGEVLNACGDKSVDGQSKDITCTVLGHLHQHRDIEGLQVTLLSSHVNLLDIDSIAVSSQELLFR